MDSLEKIIINKDNYLEKLHVFTFNNTHCRMSIYLRSPGQFNQDHQLHLEAVFLQCHEVASKVIPLPKKQAVLVHEVTQVLTASCLTHLSVSIYFACFYCFNEQL